MPNSGISNIRSLARSISRQLAGWASSLQNKDIKGQRHLTEASKHHYDQRKRSEQFMEQLKREHQERLETLKRRNRGSGEEDVPKE